MSAIPAAWTIGDTAELDLNAEFALLAAKPGAVPCAVIVGPGDMRDVELQAMGVTADAELLARWGSGDSPSSGGTYSAGYLVWGVRTAAFDAFDFSSPNWVMCFAPDAWDDDGSYGVKPLVSTRTAVEIPGKMTAMLLDWRAFDGNNTTPGSAVVMRTLAVWDVVQGVQRSRVWVQAVSGLNLTVSFYKSDGSAKSWWHLPSTSKELVAKNQTALMTLWRH